MRIAKIIDYIGRQLVYWGIVLELRARKIKYRF